MILSKIGARVLVDVCGQLEDYLAVNVVEAVSIGGFDVVWSDVFPTSVRLDVDEDCDDIDIRRASFVGGMSVIVMVGAEATKDEDGCDCAGRFFDVDDDGDDGDELSAELPESAASADPGEAGGVMLVGAKGFGTGR